MKTVSLLLIGQVVLGLVVSFLAFGHIHSAALGMENGRRLQADF